MKTNLIVGIFIVLLSCAAGNAASRVKFEVKLSAPTKEIQICEIVFYETKPSPSVVDKIVRASLESAALVDPSIDILATAFLGDDTLKQGDYSGSLLWKSKEKKIVSMDEEKANDDKQRGLKSTSEDRTGYFVEIKEEATARGIKPETRWVTVSLVFPQPPQQEAAYKALVAEIEEASKQGMRVSGYVYVGEKQSKGLWRQVRDTDGSYVFAEYNPRTRSISHKTTVLKVVP